MTPLTPAERAALKDVAERAIHDEGMAAYERYLAEFNPALVLRLLAELDATPSASPAPDADALVRAWHDGISQPLSERDVDDLRDRITSYAASHASRQVAALEAENFALAANQCHEGYAGEHGDHMCRIEDRLKAAERQVAEAVAAVSVASDAKRADAIWHDCDIVMFPTTFDDAKQIMARNFAEVRAEAVAAERERIAAWHDEQAQLSSGIQLRIYHVSSAKHVRAGDKGGAG